MTEEKKGEAKPGAKPGLKILKFWQGTVEIILRSSIVVRNDSYNF